jgi:hypothetical protein
LDIGILTSCRNPHAEYTRQFYTCVDYLRNYAIRSYRQAFAQGAKQSNNVHIAESSNSISSAPLHRLTEAGIYAQTAAATCERHLAYGAKRRTKPMSNSLAQGALPRSQHVQNRNHSSSTWCNAGRHKVRFDTEGCKRRIVKPKGRPAAQGFSQQSGVNYQLPAFLLTSHGHNDGRYKDNGYNE